MLVLNKHAILMNIANLDMLINPVMLINLK